MSPDFRAKVIADLEKTGFPSEFRVRAEFKKHGARWDCTATMGYLDLDERKSRSVDLWAFMPCGNRVSRTKHTHTVWHLVIEVKKSEKPWIVFKERRDVIRDVTLWDHDLVTFRNLPCEWEGNFSWRIYEHSPCKGLDWVGFGVQEGFKEPSEISRPYGAMISVVKAAEHFHNLYKRDGAERTLTDDISVNPTSVNFIRPIVVVDGPLLAASLGDSGNLEVDEIQMAPMHMTYRSAEYKRERYRVDIVQLAALGTYLDATEAQHDAIRDAIIDYGGLRGVSEDELIAGSRPDPVRVSKPPRTARGRSELDYHI